MAYVFFVALKLKMPSWNTTRQINRREVLYFPVAYNKRRKLIEGYVTSDKDIKILYKLTFSPYRQVTNLEQTWMYTLPLSTQE
jgi:hypothetical protein